jgi:hypothetical protein
MKDNINSKFEILPNSELILTNGGGIGTWSPTFWWGYVAAEVLEGIQRGLAADCSETCAYQNK